MTTSLRSSWLGSEHKLSTPSFLYMDIYEVTPFLPEYRMYYRFGYTHKWSGRVTLPVGYFQSLHINLYFLNAQEL